MAGVLLLLKNMLANLSLPYPTDVACLIFSVMIVIIESTLAPTLFRYITLESKTN